MSGSIKMHVKQSLPALLLIILIMAGASLASKKFFVPANLRNILMQTAVLAIAALAQSMVLFVGGIDMSVGSVISMSTILVALLSRDSLVGLCLSIVCTLGMGALVGFVNGIGVEYLRVPAMIITISTQALVKGIGLILMPSSGGNVHGALSFLVRKKVGILSFAFIAALFLYSTIFFFLHFTGYGRKIYAVGNSYTHAEQFGIDARKTVISVYIISGFLSAMAGILFAARISSGNPIAGDSYAMDSIAAAVIGGISMNGGVGTVLGALFGAITLSLINNTMNNLGISPYFQYIIKGALLMVALMVFQLRRGKNI